MNSARVQILHVPDCPLVDRLRAEVASTLERVAPHVALYMVQGD